MVLKTLHQHKITVVQRKVWAEVFSPHICEVLKTFYFEITMDSRELVKIVPFTQLASVGFECVECVLLASRILRPRERKANGG